MLFAKMLAVDGANRRDEVKLMRGTTISVTAWFGAPYCSLNPDAPSVPALPWQDARPTVSHLLSHVCEPREAQAGEPPPFLVRSIQPDITAGLLGSTVSLPGDTSRPLDLRPGFVRLFSFDSGLRALHLELSPCNVEGWTSKDLERCVRQLGRGTQSLSTEGGATTLTSLFEVLRASAGDSQTAEGDDGRPPIEERTLVQTCAVLAEAAPDVCDMIVRRLALGVDPEEPDWSIPAGEVANVERWDRSEVFHAYAAPRGAGVVLVPREGSTYLVRNLPLQFLTQYTTLGILAAHQRMALLGIYGRAAMHPASAATGATFVRSLSHYRSTRAAAINFAVRHRFDVVTDSPSMQEYYERCQAAFGVPRLADELRHTIDGLGSIVETDHVERLAAKDRTNQAIATAALLPALILTLLGVNIQGLTDGDGLPLSLVAALTAASALPGVLLLVRTRRST